MNSGKNKENEIDIAIIGAGITGLSAALAAYFKNPDLQIKLYGIPYDSNTAKKGDIENIPGIEKVIGVDYIQNVTEQLEKLNKEFGKIETKFDANLSKEESNNEKQSLPPIDITNNRVDSVEKEGFLFKLKIENKEIYAKSIILAYGLPELKNQLKGEEKFAHKGVSYCAVCDGALFRGKKVCIIGKDNYAVRGALFLRKYCRKVTILCPEKDLQTDLRFYKRIDSASNINIQKNIKLDSIEILGDQVVNQIKYEKDGKILELSVNAVFIELKDKPDLSIVKDINLELDDNGFIKTSKSQTSVPGLFVSGTIKGERDYVPILMGDGYKTGLFAAEYLEQLTD